MVMMVLSVTSYILLRNYIKSQHALASLFEEMGYILLRNYIKSQLEAKKIVHLQCYILLRNYIKSQLGDWEYLLIPVISY